VRLLAGLAVLSVGLVAARPGAPPPPPPGQFGRERAFSPGHDDWEPSIVADAHGHVYVMTTRYGAPPACPTDCPQHFLVVRRSMDGGRTFGSAHKLCACKGWGAQNDPVFAVDDAGELFAVWMNDYHVVFSHSNDFGATWARYQELDRGLKFSDKPWMGVSPSGRDVYVTFNANPLGRPYALASHDGGRSWSAPVAMAMGGRYWFATGVTVLPDGTVLTSQIADVQDYQGRIREFVVRSTDGGRTWTRSLVAVSAEPPKCPRGFGCRFGFLGGQVVVASDRHGNAYVVFTRNAEDRGPARVWFRRSTDGGATWSAPRVVAAAMHVDHEFPMIAATGDGDVRVAWMDNRTGRWNTYFVRTLNRGRTWSREVRLSNVVGSRPYKDAAGFDFPYGDYGQLAIDGRGRTWAAWGEGTSWTGPGSTWYTHSR
jgi:hypothetical protein